MVDSPFLVEEELVIAQMVLQLLDPRRGGVLGPRFIKRRGNRADVTGKLLVESRLVEGQGGPSIISRVFSWVMI